MQIIGLISFILGLLLGLCGIAFKIFWRKIPLVHVGVITIKGERKDPEKEKPPFFKKEGWRFFADFFPFFYSYEPIKIEKNNQKIENLNDIRCKALGSELHSGGEISVKIGLTWQPDYIHNNGKRLYSYIESGEKKGVEEIIRDMIEEDTRQMGREMTWEEYSFGTDELTRRLVKKLTGEEPRDPDKEDIRTLIEEMGKNGFPDIADLGIIIWRFNIGKIKEQGKLADAAEGQAIEIQERRKEVFEVDTEIKQAKQIFEAYKKEGQTEKTFEDCLLEIRRRKTIREGKGAVWDFQGLENLRSIIRR